MSWCRWSSDNFACDLYVYDGYDGTAVHVARRYESDLPHAGTSRVFATPADAADWIDELAALGYQVPDGLTDDMRSECEA